MTITDAGHESKVLNHPAAWWLPQTLEAPHTNTSRVQPSLIFLAPPPALSFLPDAGLHQSLVRTTPTFPPWVNWAHERVDPVLSTNHERKERRKRRKKKQLSISKHNWTPLFRPAWIFNKKVLEMFLMSWLCCILVYSKCCLCRHEPVHMTCCDVERCFFDEWSEKYKKSLIQEVPQLTCGSNLCQSSQHQRVKYFSTRISLSLHDVLIQCCLTFWLNSKSFPNYSKLKMKNLKQGHLSVFVSPCWHPDSIKHQVGSEPGLWAAQLQMLGQMFSWHVSS